MNANRFHETKQPAASRLLELVRSHEDWRRRCLNLCAAENALSPAVRSLLSGDLAQRYGDYEGRDLGARKYFGTREIVGLERFVEELAREVFGADHVELRPVSGHTCGNALMMGLCQPGDTVMELSREGGGHRLARKLATSPLIPLRVEDLPINPDTLDIDPEATAAAVDRLRPRLVIVGSSNFIFPVRLRELKRALAPFPEVVLVYDASHVLGLIAGGRFQNPLEEGADLVLAGTQKSFPGPQGGIIYSNRADLMDRLSAAVYPALLSNHHLARLPALGMALAEMQDNGADYADAVIANARSLAGALARRDLPVLGADRGFTASHTVLLRRSEALGKTNPGALLDEHDVIGNTIALPPQSGGVGLRLGSAEVTRCGADASWMEAAGEVIADLLTGRERGEPLRHRVHHLAEKLTAPSGNEKHPHL